MQTLIEKGSELFPEDARWYLLQAEIDAENKEYLDAVGYQIAAMELTPNEHTLLQLGELIFKAERPEKLPEIFNRFPEFAKSPAVIAMKARAIYKLGGKKKASQLFTECFENARSYNDTKLISSYIINVAGGDSLLKLVNNVSNIEKSSWCKLYIAEEQLRSNNFKAVITTTQELIPTLNPQLKLRAMQMLGNAMYSIKNYTGAKEIFTTVINEYPEDLGTLNNLAYLLTDNLNDPATALPLAEKAYKLQPYNTQILDTYGWVLYCNKEYQQAREILAKSLRIKPISPALLHLGMTYQQMDMSTSAKDMFEKAIKQAKLERNQDVENQAQKMLKNVN